MAEQNLLTLWDWLSLIVYVIVVVALGSRFIRRQTTAEHYFTADGTIPGWAAGMSMFATLLSSFLFIGFPGHTYQFNWEVLMQQFMVPFIVVAVAIFIIPQYRSVVKISAYEYLEQRFGYFARVYGTIGFLTGHFVKIGVVLSAMSLALNSITGWNQDAILIALGLTTIAYTFAGGMEGVIWTDVLQGFLMMFAGFVTIFVILFVASPDGPAAIWNVVTTDDKLKLINPEFSMTDRTVWVIVWMGIFHFGSRYATDQTMVQRYLTASSLREARKGALVSVVACMIVWITFSMIGTLLYGFYQLHPERLGAAIAKGDQVFPYFIGRELPPGLTGLVLAGLFAATMSTLSSDLNSFSACVVSDFYDRFRKGRSETARLLVSRISVVAVGICAVALAAWITRNSGGLMNFVLDAWAAVGAVFGGGVLAAFFLGFFCPRANRRGLYPALIVGIVFVAWCYLTSNEWLPLPESLSILKYRWHEWWLMGFSNVLVFALGYGLSVLLPAGNRASAPRTP
ncbi:MAG: sodium:solute symporter [Candidatus Hydrogenedentes bacterium]|nr:sodium:solute symporter [Candidatus Hydrogenedentota bacterium]